MSEEFSGVLVGRNSGRRHWVRLALYTNAPDVLRIEVAPGGDTEKRHTLAVPLEYALVMYEEPESKAVMLPAAKELQKLLGENE